MRWADTWLARLRRMNPQLRLFVAGTILAGMAGGIFETTFNNFLHDGFAIGADTRGMLEFPRETPGFLVALFAGLLFFVAETAIAALAAALIAVGMLGLAAWGAHWNSMLAFMVLWSVGAHLIMPVQSSIGMDLADRERKGRRMGQIYGAGVASGVLGCGLVWLGMRYGGAGYRFLFAAGGLAALAGAAVFARMRMPGAHLQRPKFVWHRRYWLYYVLAFLFGARKQIFITFGPWVLVRVFGQPAYVFAQLWIVSALIGMVFQPALGRAIDRFGERAVLIADAVLVFAVCLGYGLAHLLPVRAAALGLLFACYVADNLLFGVNMARSTYLSKIAVRPDHVAPTLALGISINHAVSMTIPAFGGLLWMRHGHSSVFLAAAGIAVLMLAFSLFVRVPKSG
jgi:MFS family permease